MWAEQIAAENIGYYKTQLLHDGVYPEATRILETPGKCDEGQAGPLGSCCIPHLELKSTQKIGDRLPLKQTTSKYSVWSAMS